MNDLVSIIVPIYNVEKYLEICLNSIIKQTYKNIEIILVDDGSTDLSGKICDEYKKKDRRIKVIHKKNGGVSSARNCGIIHAKGEYLLFIDSDDYIDLNVIESLISNKGDSLVCVSYKKISKEIIYEVESKSKYSTIEFVDDIMNNVILGRIWGILFDSEIAKKVLFNENQFFMEDTLFLIEYLKHSEDKTIKIIDDCFYYYNNNPYSITVSKKDSLKKLINKYDSLILIDNITNHQYLASINNVVLRDLEFFMENVIVDKYDFVFDNILIDKYTGKGTRYKLFYILYSRKKTNLIRLYYFFKKIYKRINSNFTK